MNKPEYHSVVDNSESQDDPVGPDIMESDEDGDYQPEEATDISENRLHKVSAAPKGRMKRKRYSRSWYKIKGHNYFTAPWWKTVALTDEFWIEFGLRISPTILKSRGISAKDLRPNLMSERKARLNTSSKSTANLRRTPTSLAAQTRVRSPRLAQRQCTVCGAQSNEAGECPVCAAAQDDGQGTATVSVQERHEDKLNANTVLTIKDEVPEVSQVDQSTIRPEKEYLVLHAGEQHFVPGSAILTSQTSVGRSRYVVHINGNPFYKDAAKIKEIKHESD